MFRTALIISVLFAAAVSFSQRSLMPFGLTGKFMLVSMKEVKKEIKLTSDQDKQIQALLKQMQDDPTAMGMPDMHYLTRGVDKKIVALLDETQASRLQELFLQFNGLMTLSEEEVSKPLGLSEEVAEKVKAAIRAHDKEATEVLMETQKTRKVDSKKLEAMDKKTVEELTALLSSEQLETWKKMQGAPFKFPKMGR